MKSLLQKLNNAKLEIKETKIQKQGHNSFSNYDYFTPDQIEFLVAQACKNNGLLTTFDLIRNDLGIYGELTIYEIETGKNLKLQMATEIPTIKATNIAQQLGGCMTYTERYLKTSAFGITDNRLDFDTMDNTKKQNELTEAEKTANWIKAVGQKKKIVENAGHNFLDLIVKLGVNSEKELEQIAPQSRLSIMKQIEIEIRNLRENK